MKTSYKTKTICSSSFKWIDNKGTANGSELIILGKQHMEKHDGILVKSIRTGAEKYFEPVHDGIFVKSIKTGVEKYFEPVHDEDGYDGEFMIYRCDQLFIQIWNY